MFSWLLIFILFILSITDMFLLLWISKGGGIIVIILSQLAGAVWGLWKINRMDFTLFFFLDAEIKKGSPIIHELWEEVLILTGACLLVIPGFITDLIGILFLIPQLRTFCLELMHAP